MFNSFCVSLFLINRPICLAPFFFPKVYLYVLVVLFIFGICKLILSSSEEVNISEAVVFNISEAVVFNLVSERLLASFAYEYTIGLACISLDCISWVGNSLNCISVACISLACISFGFICNSWVCICNSWLWGLICISCDWVSILVIGVASVSNVAVLHS